MEQIACPHCKQIIDLFVSVARFSSQAAKWSVPAAPPAPVKELEEKK